MPFRAGAGRCLPFRAVPGAGPQGRVWHVVDSGVGRVVTVLVRAAAVLVRVVAVLYE